MYFRLVWRKYNYFPECGVAGNLHSSEPSSVPGCLDPVFTNHSLKEWKYRLLYMPGKEVSNHLFTLKLHLELFFSFLSCGRCLPRSEIPVPVWWGFIPRVTYQSGFLHAAAPAESLAHSSSFHNRGCSHCHNLDKSFLIIFQANGRIVH